MAQQAQQSDGAGLPHDSVSTAPAAVEPDDAHLGMTHMLFVDAIIGLGFPHKDVGIQASQEGMAIFVGGNTHFGWAWSRYALEKLGVDDLQEMYLGLKFYEVTH
jgi:hypothetical protein